jgi:high-affinity Fe2+/Pb2+ permease
MNITENQSRNLYAIFTVMFAVSLAYTIWNFHEQKKVRDLEKQIAEEKLRLLQDGSVTSI